MLGESDREQRGYLGVPNAAGDVQHASMDMRVEVEIPEATNRALERVVLHDLGSQISDRAGRQRRTEPPVQDGRVLLQVSIVELGQEVRHLLRHFCECPTFESCVSSRRCTSQHREPDRGEAREARLRFLGRRWCRGECAHCAAWG